MNFWTQLLLNAVIGGALSTIVGVVVGFLFKRWLRSVFEPEQKAATAAAHTAAARAGDAVDEARAARAEAKTAKESAGAAERTVLELKDAQGRIVEWLPEGDEAVEYLKETNSRLVAQLVIQATKHPEDFASPDAPRFIVPVATPGEDGPATVTGKHRLHSPHTLRLQTIGETSWE